MYTLDGLLQTYDCHHTSRDPFCWPVTSLRVEVIESYDYAYKWNHKPHYSFDVDVSARCTKDKLPTPGKRRVGSIITYDVHFFVVNALWICLT